MNARHTAVLVLTPLLNKSGSLKYALAKQIAHCPANEQPLLQEICYGSLRFYPQISQILSLLLSKKLKKKDNDIYAVLLIGIYQLYKMRIAHHAAISETVDLCKALKKPWATALVNACLRNFQRSKDEIFDELQANQSFVYNHPDWYVQKLKANWPEHWQQILAENDNHPPLTLRVNTNIVSRETIKQELASQGISCSDSLISTQALILEKPQDITQLEAFTKGLISVQDEAAQLAAPLLDIQAHDVILDACSAPGGKLLHALELADGKQVSIQGLELEEFRANKIKENFQRIKLECPLHIADATTTAWWDQQKFDKILLDAPCSATGVIRRNPDIKLLREPEDIHQIAKLQIDILQNLWTMLKENGKLIYATCSIFTQENEKIIKRFIEQTPDAQHVEIAAHWGEAREYGRQLFPAHNSNDGFYYAVIHKTSTPFDSTRQ